MAALQDINVQQTAKRVKERFGIDILSYRSLVFAICSALTLMGAYVIGSTDYGIYVIAGLVGLIVSLVVMLRPHIGMYILVGFIYTNGSDLLIETVGLPSTNKVLVALIFVSVVGTQIMMRRKALVFRMSEAAMLMYLGVAAFATVAGVGLSQVSVDELMDFAKDFVIVFIIVQLASEEQAWKRTQIMLILVCVFVSSLTWYQIITNDYTQDFYGLATSRTDSVGDTSSDIDFYRVGGPVGDPNFYAVVLLMVYPIALYRALDPNASKNEKIFGAVSTAIILGAIVFTYSRSALIVLILVTGLILLERRINVFKAGFIGLLIITLVFPILPTAYKNRMLTIVGIGSALSSGSADVSTTGRISESLAALQMFIDHPLFGVGYSRYESNYLNYSIYLGLDGRLEEREAHNFYLETLAETGVVGGAALIFFMWTIYTSTQRARILLQEAGRQDLIPWLAALQFGLLAYFINSIFLHDAFARYFRLSMGLALSSTALVDAIVAQQVILTERKRIAQFDEALPITDREVIVTK